MTLVKKTRELYENLGEASLSEFFLLIPSSKGKCTHEARNCSCSLLVFFLTTQITNTNYLISWCSPIFTFRSIANAFEASSLSHLSVWWVALNDSAFMLVILNEIWIFGLTPDRSYSFKVRRTTNWLWHLIIGEKFGLHSRSLLLHSFLTELFTYENCGMTFRLTSSENRLGDNFSLFIHSDN